MWLRDTKIMDPRISLIIIVLLIITGSSFLVGNHVLGQVPEGEVWEIRDTITPTLEEIEWREEGVFPRSPSWILDGRWFWSACHQILVKAGGTIFASFGDDFNWTAVNEGFEGDGWHRYPSFEDFQNETLRDPRFWLMYTWGVSVDWLGISMNRTKIMFEFDPSTSHATVTISCIITNLPAFFLETANRQEEIGIAGEKLPKPMFAGLNLDSIYIGDFEALELIEEYREDFRHFKLFFKAPANLLSQYRDTYSILLLVDPRFTGTQSHTFRSIEVSMPSETAVYTASPANMSQLTDNKATFMMGPEDHYPDVLQVESGPPVKDLPQMIYENAGRWLVDPATWVAFVTLVALSYTAFRGKQMWNRRKTYYRLYKSMVNTYDHYSSNFKEFQKEMDTLSKSITKYFIEDKINDDQFDRLLTRRDDLVKRASEPQRKGSTASAEN